MPVSRQVTADDNWQLPSSALRVSTYCYGNAPVPVPAAELVAQASSRSIPEEPRAAQDSSVISNACAESLFEWGCCGRELSRAWGTTHATYPWSEQGAHKPSIITAGLTCLSESRGLHGFTLQLLPYPAVTVIWLERTDTVGG
jgi:hypothetical protein